MLTAEQNDELTQVARGTPMGELLRRYWYPVAFTRELEEFPVKAVRLLGEDLALFKTPRGRYGLVPEACPHRRASLAYGVVEADGLRCPYHGWMFGTDGSCLDQPAEREETNFRERVRAQAFSAAEMGGLVWGYIGPQPAPELPRFDVFVMDGVRDIGWADLPCNFVQIMENAVDPHHTEWLHGRFFEFMARHQGFDAPPSFGKKHVKVGFDAFEWGIIKRRVVEGASEEDDDWKIGHPLVFPYNMRVGGANIEQMQIRVPIDRTTTRFMLYSVHAPDGIEFPEQPIVPDYQIPLREETRAELGLTDLTEANVLVIVNKVADTLTANLQGPLVIHATTRVAAQVVISEKKYQTRHPIVQLQRPGKPTTAPAQGAKEYVSKSA